MKTDGSDKDEKLNQKGSADDQARKTLQHQIEKMANQFQNALPNKIGVERMLRIVMTAILTNPKLAQCEPNSFFGAVLQSLQLGLEVNTPLGQAYLIPRWDKNAWGKGRPGFKCNFQMGYQGLLELCYRYGRYRQITAEIVYQGDDFAFEKGTAQFLRHIPKGKNDTPTHVWALYELDNGGQRFVVWTWEKIMEHAKRFSESYDNETGKWSYSAWSSNEESQQSMGKKTVLSDVLSYAPKSVELINAILADEKAVIAKPVTEGGETKFQFDIETNNLLEDDRDNPNRVKEKPPTAATNGNGKPEPVPTNAAASQQSEKPTAAVTQSASTQPSQNGTAKKGNLFSQDEEEALEAQYQMSQGPNFEG